MGYDYTLVLCMPGLTKERCGELLRIIEGINRRPPGERKAAAEALAMEHKGLKGYRTLVDDLFAVENTVTKKFKYNTTYRATRDLPGGGAAGGTETRDFTDSDEADKWGYETESIFGPEIHGWDMKSQMLYHDGKTDQTPEASQSNFLALAAEGKATRLTIFAHGGNGQVARLDAAKMAETLAGQELKGGSKRLRISLVSCFAGATLKVGDDEVNFARDLHRILKDTHGISCEVSARTAEMKAMAVTDPNDPHKGYGKFVNEADDPTSETKLWKRKQPGSKFIWTWDGDEQVAIDRYKDGPGPLGAPVAKWEEAGAQAGAQATGEAAGGGD